MSDIEDKMKAASEKSLEEIKSHIDSEPIYESDYETICSLLDGMDDSLFLKLMEEIKDGNMSFSDFARVISAEGYDSMLSESFESQEKLYRKYTDLMEYLKEMEVINDGERLDCLAGISSDKLISSDGLGSAAKTSDGTLMSDADRKGVISDLMSSDPQDNPLKEFYKNAVLRNLFSDSGSTVDSILLSAHEYLIPVDFDSILITKSDRDFMAENDIGEDEMKKIKSLAAFAAVRVNDGYK